MTDTTPVASSATPSAASSDPIAHIHEHARALALVARAAATCAAPYLRSVARTVSDFQTKVDMHDPVTVHDRRVEEALQELLALSVPGSRALGEERGEVQLGSPDGASEAFLRDFPMPTDPATVDAMRRASGLGDRVRWIVDPIDGTSNFAAGGAYFNTSVAAELDGQVVAGAIAVPMLREVFTADAESMWWQTEDGSDRRDLRADGPSREADAVLVSYHPALSALRRHPQESQDQEIRLAEAYQAIRRPGAAALDLALVAAGWTGAMMGMSFKPWDVAAGIHMVRVAGGTALNLDRGEGLADGLRPMVLASGANLDPVTARGVLEEVHTALMAGGR